MNIIGIPCPVCTMPIMEDGECLRHDKEEMIRYGSLARAENDRMRDRMATARAALLRIWPKWKDCEHTEARRAFEALEA